MKSSDVGILIGNDVLTGAEDIKIFNCRYTEKQLQQFVKEIKEDKDFPI